MGPLLFYFTFSARPSVLCVWGHGFSSKEADGDGY